MPYAVSAAVYKWVDEEGRIHYTEKPPPAGIESTEIKPPPKINSEHAEEKLNERQELLNDLQQNRENKEQEEARKAEELAVKQRNCELGRDKLNRVQDIPRIYNTDKQGNRSKLPEEDRQQRINEARELIQKYCN